MIQQHPLSLFAILTDLKSFSFTCVAGDDSSISCNTISFSFNSSPTIWFGWIFIEYGFDPTFLVDFLLFLLLFDFAI